MRILIGLALVLIFLILASITGPDKIVGSWLSVLPPFFAILLAFVTRRVLLSLFIAVLGGTLIASNFVTQGGLGNLTTGVGQVFVHGYGSVTDPTNMQILGFVFFIFAALKIVVATGGLIGFVTRLASRVRTKRSAEAMTGFLGLLMFIDDYANTIIVGASMQKICDRFKVTREKLAFIVDATSAPVSGVAIVSTWIGYEVGLFSDLAEKFSVGKDGYGIFFDVLAMRFYCFFMLVFVFWNIATGYDFGPMRSIRSTGSDDETPSESFVDTRLPAVISGIVPILSIILLVFFGLWVDGGGLEEGIFYSFESWRNILSASENGTYVLLLASIFGFFMAAILALGLARISFQKVFGAILEGVKSSLLPVFILALAWSLKIVADELGTGTFILSIIDGSIPRELFPALVFIVAGLVAFATGTSWGTMAILIPTVAPVAIHFDGGYGLITMLTLASILDGAIFGDHCSPISDTTIMSSVATGCSIISHVQTQLPYAIVVGISATVLGYLLAGFGMPVFMSWFAFAAFLVLLTVFLKLKRTT